MSCSAWCVCADCFPGKFAAAQRGETALREPTREEVEAVELEVAVAKALGDAVLLWTRGI